jgi:hypothetical protein
MESLIIKFNDDSETKKRDEKIYNDEEREREENIWAAAAATWREGYWNSPTKKIYKNKVTTVREGIFYQLKIDYILVVRGRCSAKSSDIAFSQSWKRFVSQRHKIILLSQVPVI